jgi:hypothetical protein
MKLLSELELVLVLACLLGICFVGAFAALCGLRRLDAWCARQLND